MPNQKVHVVAVVGTRPEVVKMAPVISALKATEWAQVSVLATAQHRHMLDQALALFGISADVDLDVMRPNQALPALTSRLITAVDEAFERLRPDAVLGQGDTTTVLATALAAFYRRVPFGHVEAGLRTGTIDNPCPEEMNRVLCAPLARWHFAPTPRAAENLRRENIPAASIHITGNTVIDSLLQVARTVPPSQFPRDPRNRLVLVTAHRRESFGRPMREAMLAIRELADMHADLEFLYPVHPNPNVRSLADELLAGHPRIALVEPLAYGDFVAAMKAATLILTDSGGVQEEAPALGKPVLVMRNDTERPEAVEAGVARLVGTDRTRIVAEVNRLLNDELMYQSMARGVSPFGDGKAAHRIVALLCNDLNTQAALGRPLVA
ncbi:MAG: UDP-N-acetylglucosamine 2-epimerase (non-hydrolyzing) [Burkholderiales bacterium]|jgi:UDP-N-acetylglucosamine 2-epimerase (non-hydrolysing)|nr:UDP-N-acetylglucosamine 2-epimerase (non-hydrolyzing) [Burkholderiales bacterium]